MNGYAYALLQVMQADIHVGAVLKYADAPTTVLEVKDRVSRQHPPAAIHLSQPYSTNIGHPDLTAS
jgi:hypothetical protein